jgi:hypothetical protein
MNSHPLSCFYKYSRFSDSEIRILYAKPGLLQPAYTFSTASRVDKIPAENQMIQHHGSGENHDRTSNGYSDFPGFPLISFGGMPQRREQSPGNVINDGLSGANEISGEMQIVFSSGLFP